MISVIVLACGGLFIIYGRKIMKNADYKITQVLREITQFIMPAKPLYKGLFSAISAGHMDILFILNKQSV